MGASVVRVQDRRRWPLPALLDACKVPRAQLARKINVSSHTVAVAEQRGLTDVQADEWSIRLGLHPILVWGWAWIEAAAADGPSHQVVADDLRARIESGELQPGDVIPTARALGERWGVSRAAAARATAELRAEGLLTGGRGSPNRVAGPAPAASSMSASGLPCAECGDPLDIGDEHFPHEPGCGGADSAWCACDRPVHAGCCPTCSLAVAR
jgi:hypothetical protein